MKKQRFLIYKRKREDYLTNYIQDYPLVKAAMTEAVHRFFYDNVLDDQQHRWTPQKRKAFKKADTLLSNLWCENPDWRAIIQKAANRYTQGSRIITSIHVNNKPSKRMNVTMNLKIA